MPAIQSFASKPNSAEIRKSKVLKASNTLFISAKIILTPGHSWRPFVAIIASTIHWNLPKPKRTYQRLSYSRCSISSGLNDHFLLPDVKACSSRYPSPGAANQPHLQKQRCRVKRLRFTEIRVWKLWLWMLLQIKCFSHVGLPHLLASDTTVLSKIQFPRFIHEASYTLSSCSNDQLATSQKG